MEFLYGGVISTVFVSFLGLFCGTLMVGNPPMAVIDVTDEAIRLSAVRVNLSGSSGLQSKLKSSSDPCLILPISAGFYVTDIFCAH